MSQALDRIVFATGRVTVGQWRCARTDPRFVDSGPIERHLVAFPRTSLIIRHAGAPAFVSDAGVATVYNRGQRYTREAIDPAGDRCDWWAVDAGTAGEIAAALGMPAGTHDEKPLSFARAPVDARLYLRQRALLLRMQEGGIDLLGAEEAALAIVYDTLAAGARAAGASGSRVSRAAGDLADAAAREIAASWRQRLTLDILSRRLGASPFHLCRSFHAVMGRTLHRHLTALRLRASLEAIREGRHELTQIALDHGFSSHSHFTAAFRREFGVAPAQWRGRARANS